MSQLLDEIDQILLEINRLHIDSPQFKQRQIIKNLRDEYLRLSSENHAYEKALDTFRLVIENMNEARE